MIDASETIKRWILVLALLFVITNLGLDLAWCMPRARPGHEAWCSRPMWPDGAPP